MDMASADSSAKLFLEFTAALKKTEDENLSVDEYWMTEALKESLRSVGLSNPNPAVGCVIVKDGVEIARGHTQAYGGVHAERMAFSLVKDQRVLRGATVYVTLEPCSHFGHQPPCAGLLCQSAIKRVVVGRGDPDERVRGRGIKLLLEAGKIVSQGILESEITAWNYPFFMTRTPRGPGATATPIIALKWAQTLDGQLADDWGKSKWISGSSSRAYTHWLRQKYDVILVGVGTFLADSPRLDVRDCKTIQRSPKPIVFDPQGKIFSLRETDLRAEKLSQKHDEPIYFIVHETALEQQNRSHWIFKNKNIRLLKLPEGSQRALSDQIVAVLIAASPDILGKPLQSIFVEGGPKLLSSFLRDGAADVLHVFIAPKMTGGIENRLNLTLPLESSQKFDVIATAQLENDFLVEMTPVGQWAKVAPAQIPTTAQKFSAGVELK